MALHVRFAALRSLSSGHAGASCCAGCSLKTISPTWTWSAAVLGVQCTRVYMMPRRDAARPRTEDHNCTPVSVHSDWIQSKQQTGHWPSGSPKQPWSALTAWHLHLKASLDSLDRCFTARTNSRKCARMRASPKPLSWLAFKEPHTASSTLPMFRSAHDCCCYWVQVSNLRSKEYPRPVKPASRTSPPVPLLLCSLCHSQSCKQVP